MIPEDVQPDGAAPAAFPGPLAGIRIVEVGHSVAAPFCGQILADLGATVIKVENPAGGDDARHWGPPFWHGSSATFQSLNRNKISVAVNLKDKTEREKLKRLIRASDAVVQNMRPGLMERYGMAAEDFRETAPGLIYCNLGAYGEGGPLGRATGYDPLMQAFSGIMSVTGEPDRPPVRVGPSIIDQGTGMWCAIAILAALLQRGKTGRGARLDTSLFETAVSWMTVPLANSIASGRDSGKNGSETPMLVPYRAFMAKDRHIVIAAGNDNLFGRLCDVMGVPEWAETPQFLRNQDRVANRRMLNEMIEKIIGMRRAEHWLAALEAVGVPCAMVHRVSEVLSHPQTQSVDMILPAPDRQISLVGTPIRFDGKRPPVRSSAPELGATTIDDLLFPNAEREMANEASD